MLKAYYDLGKPRLAYGNLITAIAGFFFANGARFGWTLIPLLIGLGCVIMSACVFNNYFDREIDAKMARTKERGLVSGAVSVRGALIYGTALGIVGFVLLYIYVNPVTAVVALFGFLVYVCVYTPLKPRTHLAVFVGALSGATPIAAGYTAVTGNFDMLAALLFLILALWQIPHFYAISIYRQDEYAAAGVPLLPAAVGPRVTKWWITAFVILFSLAAFSLSYFGYTGIIFFIDMLIFCLAWLLQALGGFWAIDERRWARGVFYLSLIVLLDFSVFLAVAPLFH